MSGAENLTAKDYDVLLRVFDDWIAEGFTSNDSPLMQHVEGLRMLFAEDYAENQADDAEQPP